MKRVEVPFDSVRPTERNIRRKCQRVLELADSIARYGLLQNLVVVEREPGVYEVKAGERRRRALEVLHLPAEVQVEKYGRVVGCWEGPVPVLVYEGDGDTANAVENIQRDELYPWELGRRFAEWNDAGMMVRDIAARVGRSNGWVSGYMTLGRCLSPKVSEAIERMGECPLSTHQLSKIAALYDGIMLEPIHDQQVELFERMLGEPKGGRRQPEPRGQQMRVYQRLQKLRRQSKGRSFPGHARPYLKAFLEYLYADSPMKKLSFNWD